MPSAPDKDFIEAKPKRQGAKRLVAHYLLLAVRQETRGIP